MLHWGLKWNTFDQHCCTTCARCQVVNQVSSISQLFCIALDHSVPCPGQNGAANPEQYVTVERTLIDTSGRNSQIYFPFTSKCKFKSKITNNIIVNFLETNMVI